MKKEKTWNYLHYKWAYECNSVLNVQHPDTNSIKLLVAFVIFVTVITSYTYIVKFIYNVTKCSKMRNCSWLLYLCSVNSSSRSSHVFQYSNISSELSWWAWAGEPSLYATTMSPFSTCSRNRSAAHSKHKDIFWTVQPLWKIQANHIIYLSRSPGTCSWHHCSKPQHRPPLEEGYRTCCLGTVWVYQKFSSQ